LTSLCNYAMLILVKIKFDEEEFKMLVEDLIKN